MNAAASKRKKEAGSPARGPASRRRLQTVNDDHIATRPLISEQAEARCDNAYQAYILSMAQKLALQKACDNIKANVDEQLCVLEDRQLTAQTILNYKSKVQVCKALQHCSIASDCLDQVLSLQDDFVSKQSQALQGLVESIRNELTLLPQIGIELGESIDQVAEGAMSLEESILEGDEVCKDAVDTQDTLKKVFASMCRIQTEYISMEDLPHEASLMLPGINFSINKI